MSFPDLPAVIVLNGPSSSGKSTLAKALQERLEAVYMHLSIDAFWGTLPQKAFVPEVIAEVGPPVITGFHRCLAALAGSGNKIIVDTVLTDQKWAGECIELLRPYHPIYVRVCCPVAELERREQMRGDRGTGTARQQLGLIDLYVQHDMEVNTLEHSPAQCAEQIRQHLVSCHSRS